MTSLDKDSFSVNAVGNQAQSQRKSAPSYSISTVGREQREKVWLNKEMFQNCGKCKHSPAGGPIYTLPHTMNLKSGVSFSKGPCTDFLNVKPDDCLSVNDELHIMVDSQYFKYDRDCSHLIGTEPRGRLKDAELIKNHSAAFFGRDSPGPAAIGDQYGPKIDMTRPRMAPARTFGEKLQMSQWANSDTPAHVGPGVYPRKDIAIGKQYLSHRRNQTANEFGKSPKFGKTKSADTISVIDAARSAYGKQVLSNNKSEPTIGFGRGTRDQRSRTAVCMTAQDLGPKAFMPKQRMEMPRLPREAEIMKTGHM